MHVCLFEYRFTYGSRSCRFCQRFRQQIEVKIIDDEEYEKNEFFFVQLGEPVLLDERKQFSCHLNLFVKLVFGFLKPYF